MSVQREQMIVEVRRLRELADGSYENLLQSLSSAVAESQKWNRKASLFATHPDHVVVYVEGEGFFSCKYYITESGVKFGEEKKEDVPIVGEDSLVSRGIDSLYAGGSVGYALRALAVSPVIERMTPDSAKSKIDRIFGRSIWRDYLLGKNESRIVDYTSDRSLFEVSDAPMETAGDITKAKLISVLSELSNRLSRMNSLALEAVEGYQLHTGGMRTAEEDQVLSVFDSVAGNFLENIDDAIDILSVAIVEARAGNIGYSVVVMNGIVEEYGNFHLGHRFIRKMANELVSVD